MSLLCVLSAAPRTPAQVRPLARRLLSMRPCADALLLVRPAGCLFSEVMPEDAPLAARAAIRRDGRRRALSGHFLLLVRKRVWDDAARLYLGETSRFCPCRLSPRCSPTACAVRVCRRQLFARVSGRAILRRALLPRRRLLRAGCSAPHAGRVGRIRPSGRARPVPRWPTTRRFQTVCRAFFWESRAASDDSSPAAVARALSDGVLLVCLGLFSIVENRMGRTSARCGTSRLRGRRFPSARRAPPDAAGFDRLCRLPAPTVLQSSCCPPRRFGFFFFSPPCPVGNGSPCWRS